jgi:hypothetical protein
MKLKHSEIKNYRTQQLLEQNNCCALCLEPIIDDAVLDHDHRSGCLRRVLHRGCNALLGHIENNMPRNKMTNQRLTVFAQRLIEYITTEHTLIRHPTHLTKEEKYEKLTRKRIKNRKKQKEAKAAR